MKVYLAGPMSGWPEHNFPAFRAAAQHLRTLGYEVISPCELSEKLGVQGKDDGTIDVEAYAICMRADVFALLEVEGIVLLPNWRASRGAKLEFTIAKALNLKIMEYEGLHSMADIDYVTAIL